jgi:Cohesin loading factor
MLTVGILNSEKYDTEGWLSELLIRRERILRLKRYTLLYASFSGLLRSYFDEAFRCIETLHSLDREHFPLKSPDDSIYDNLLLLLVGIQHHYSGFFDIALDYYSKIPPTAGDTYIVSLLNKCIILRLGTEQDHTKAMKWLDEIERRIYIASNLSPQLRTAWNLVKGITCTEVLRSKFPILPENVTNGV